MRGSGLEDETQYHHQSYLDACVELWLEDIARGLFCSQRRNTNNLRMQSATRTHTIYEVPLLLSCNKYRTRLQHLVDASTSAILLK